MVIKRCYLRWDPAIKQLVTKSIAESHISEISKSKARKRILEFGWTQARKLENGAKRIPLSIPYIIRKPRPLNGLPSTLLYLQHCAA